MKELKANILSEEILKQADAVCFTSNGIVKANGELVMGAGIAKGFKECWPKAPEYFGRMVNKFGNRVIDMNVVYNNETLWVISFPTKHHWRNPSDLKLIEKSAKELVEIVNQQKEWNKVYLPRPGVGLGGLDWLTQVKPIIEPLLDDRFTVCYF